MSFTIATLLIPIALILGIVGIIAFVVVMNKH